MIVSALTPASRNAAMNPWRSKSAIEPPRPGRNTTSVEAGPAGDRCVARVGIGVGVSRRKAVHPASISAAALSNIRPLILNDGDTRGRKGHGSIGMCLDYLHDRLGQPTADAQPNPGS